MASKRKAISPPLTAEHKALLAKMPTTSSVMVEYGDIITEIGNSLAKYLHDTRYEKRTFGEKDFVNQKAQILKYLQGNNGIKQKNYFKRGELSDRYSDETYKELMFGKKGIVPHILNTVFTKVGKEDPIIINIGDVSTIAGINVYPAISAGFKSRNRGMSLVQQLNDNVNDILSRRASESTYTVPPPLSSYPIKSEEKAPIESITETPADDCEEEKERLENDLSDCKRENAELQKDNQTFSLENERLDTQARSLQADIKQCQEDKEKLRNIAALSTNALLQAVQEKDKVQDELEKQLIQLQKCKEELEKKKTELAERESELEGFRRTGTDFSESAQQDALRIRELQAQLETLSRECQTKADELERIKKEHDDLQTQIRKLLPEDLVPSPDSPLADALQVHLNNLGTQLSDAQTALRNTEDQSNESLEQLRRLIIATLSAIAELEKLKKANADLEAEKNRLAEQLAANNAELARTQAELVAARSETERNSAEIARLEAEIAARDSALEELRRSLAAAEGARDAAAAELKSIKDKIAALDGENAAKLAELAGKNAAAADLQALLAQRDVEIAELRNNLEKAESELSDARRGSSAEIERLSGLLEVAQRARVEAETALDAIKAQIAALESANATMSAELAKNTAAAAALTDTLAQKEAELADLRSNLEIVSGEMDEARAQLDTLTRNAGDCQIELGELRARVTELEGEITRLNDENVSKDARVRELEAELNQVTSQKNEFNRQLEELRTRHNECESQLQELRDSLASCQTELAALSASASADNAAAAALQAQLAQKEVKLAALQSQLTQVISDRDRVVAELQALQKAHDECERKLTELDNAKKAAEVERDLASADLVGKEAEIAGLKQRIADLEAEKSACAKCETELQELQANLAACEAKRVAAEAAVAGKDARIKELTDIVSKLQAQLGTQPTQGTEEGKKPDTILGFFKHASEDANNVIRMLNNGPPAPSLTTGGGSQRTPALLNSLTTVLTSNAVPFSAKSTFLVSAFLTVVASFYITMYLIRHSIISSASSAAVTFFVLYVLALTVFFLKFSTDVPLIMLLAHFAILYFALMFALRKPIDEERREEKLTIRIYTTWIIAILAVAFV